MTSEPTDAALLDLSRAGDNAAYRELWSRHSAAAVRLARQFRGNWDAEDLVSEANVRVLDLIRRGRGPQDAFRPYLFTVIRNVAQAWSKRVTDSVDDFDAFVDPDSEQDHHIHNLETNLTRRAFLALPERQRSVLWYTEVEKMTPQQISPLLGMTPNSVSALAYRAREALRVEWIQAHIHHAAASADCEWTLSRLGDYTRGNLTARNQTRAETHLANCTSCAQAQAELREVGSSLAIAILGPLVGIGVGIGYLTHTTSAATAASGGALAGAGGGVGGASGLGATGLGSSGFGAGGGATLTGALAGGASTVAAGLSVVAAATVLAVAAAVTTSALAPTPVEDGAAAQSVVTDEPTDLAALPTATPTPQPRSETPAPGSPPSVAAAPLPPVVTSIVSQNSTRPTFSGTGEPGATIQLALNDGTPVATTTVAGDGTWFIPAQSAITPAATGFSLTQTNGEGLTSLETVLGPFNFAVSPNLPQTGPVPPACGQVSWGIRGWERARVQVRTQLGAYDATNEQLIPSVGSMSGMINMGVDEPYRITISYVDNPAAAPVVFTGCGWTD